MTGFLGARLTVPLIIAIMIILSIGYRRAMQSGSELQLETERSRRPLAGVNSTLTGDLAANPKRSWVRVFREVLTGLPAYRWLSCGAAAGAGLSAPLCGDCRGRRYPSNSSGDGARRARAWFRTRHAGRSADCIGRQTR